VALAAAVVCAINKPVPDRTNVAESSSFLKFSSLLNAILLFVGIPYLVQN
jgi:hypothetical protein